MRRNKVIGTVLGVKHTADKECNEHIFHVHMTEAMIHDTDRALEEELARLQVGRGLTLILLPSITHSINPV